MRSDDADPLCLRFGIEASEKTAISLSASSGERRVTRPKIYLVEAPQQYRADLSSMRVFGGTECTSQCVGKSNAASKTANATSVETRWQRRFLPTRCEVHSIPSPGVHLWVNPLPNPDRSGLSFVNVLSHTCA